MKSKEFIGLYQVSNKTTDGGTVIVAYGNIITEDDSKLESIAIQIKDSNEEIVTQFAMIPETFGVLLDTIKELYDNSIPSI